MTKLFEGEYGVQQYYHVTVNDEIVEKPSKNTTWSLEGVDVERLQRILRAVAKSDKAMRHIGIYLTLLEIYLESTEEFDYFPGYYDKEQEEVSLIDIFKKVSFCFTPEDRKWVEEEMGEYEEELLRDQCFSVEMSGFQAFEHECERKRG